MLSPGLTLNFCCTTCGDCSSPVQHRRLSGILSQHFTFPEPPTALFFVSVRARTQRFYVRRRSSPLRFSLLCWCSPSPSQESASLLLSRSSLSSFSFCLVVLFGWLGGYPTRMSRISQVGRWCGLGFTNLVSMPQPTSASHNLIPETNNKERKHGERLRAITPRLFDADQVLEEPVMQPPFPELRRPVSLGSFLLRLVSCDP
jgi:hypothetical protein